MRAIPGMAMALAVAASAVPAWADNHRPEDWPEDSAMSLGRKAEHRLAVAEKDLERAYRELTKSLAQDAADALAKRRLIASQRAWIAHRNANCVLYGEVSGGASIWKSAHEADCRADMTEARAKELKGLIRED